MMYFIKKLFGMPCVLFLGRGGILYFDGTFEYYIDSENYVPNPKSKSSYAVIIFSKEIRYKKLNKKINDEKKNEIALKVQSMLTKDKIITAIE